MKVRIPGGPVYYYPDVMVSCGAASADTVFKEAPCLIVEVLSSSTSATDTREKLQAYQGMASLRYYVLVESERVGVSYYVRGAEGRWLAATLDPGERLQVDCGSVHASLALGDVYEDTGLAVA